jgi:hypothetical protein
MSSERVGFLRFSVLGRPRLATASVGTPLPSASAHTLVHHHPAAGPVKVSIVTGRCKETE